VELNLSTINKMNCKIKSISEVLRITFP